MRWYGMCVREVLPTAAHVRTSNSQIKEKRAKKESYARPAPALRGQVAKRELR
jgi:hypothetical protein